MTKKTVLDRIEPTADGALAVRLSKQTWDGDRLCAAGWHRIVLPVGCDADHILAANCSHLQAMGFPALSQHDMRRIHDAIARNRAASSRL